MERRPAAPEPGEAPPRVLVVLPDQWPRANLRAALREAGLDAVGCPSVLEALSHVADPRRGPVGAVLIDDAALRSLPAPAVLGLLREHSPQAALLLLGSALRRSPGGSWDRVIRRPVSIDDLVQTILELVPPGGGHPEPLGASRRDRGDSGAPGAFHHHG